MRKLAILSIFLFLGTSSLYSEIFNIGGTEIVVPAPSGFSIVTKEMGAVYRLSLQMKDPENDQLATYILDSAVPAAMNGELPIMDRHFFIKANKTLKNMVVGSDNFKEITNTIKDQNKKIIDLINSNAKKTLNNQSKGISKEFNLDFAMNNLNTIPLDPYYESENIFLYSLASKVSFSAKKDKEKIEKDAIVISTITIVNISGKIIFLYCGGSKEDLEWTRKASKEWAEDILSKNDAPPQKSTGTSTSSQNNNYKWISRIAVFIIFSLISGFLYKRGRPSKSIEKDQGSGIIKK